MARRPPSPEVDSPDQKTRLEFRVPYEVGQPPSDETLPVTSGHRLAPSVTGFRLVVEATFADGGAPHYFLFGAQVPATDFVEFTPSL